MNKLLRTTIKSISFSNTEIIKNILDLHVPSHKIDLDPCYSTGVFYNSGFIPQPTLKYDIYPQAKGVKKADCRHLPLKDASLECIMFDPPFVVNGEVKGEEASGVIARRFSFFNSSKEMTSFYKESLKEFYRLLKPKGILIFKCQDIVSGGVNYMPHCYIHNMAFKLGFYPKDLFILEARSRLINLDKTQRHARKFHCYFWVFEKGGKRDYIKNTAF